MDVIKDAANRLRERGEAKIEEHFQFEKHLRAPRTRRRGYGFHIWNFCFACTPALFLYWWTERKGQRLNAEWLSGGAASYKDVGEITEWPPSPPPFRWKVMTRRMRQLYFRDFLEPPPPEFYQKYNLKVELERLIELQDRKGQEFEAQDGLVKVRRSEVQGPSETMPVIESSEKQESSSRISGEENLTVSNRLSRSELVQNPDGKRSVVRRGSLDATAGRAFARRKILSRYSARVLDTLPSMEQERKIENDVSAVENGQEQEGKASALSLRSKARTGEAKL